MRRSLFPSDESLPSWLHTLLIVAIGTPISAYLAWYGIGALITGELAPLSGPEFGQHFFGEAELHGHSARIAGASLVLDAGAFMAFLFRFSRLAFASMATKVALALFALSMLLTYVVATS